eukprot:762662-Hanusia_phi.AAC.4
MRRERAIFGSEENQNVRKGCEGRELFLLHQEYLEEVHCKNKLAGEDCCDCCDVYDCSSLNTRKDVADM